MIKKIESYPELADPQFQPRYSGIPTFFRLPHSLRLDEVDIGLVGVPFDGGVTNRPGARHGPRDIRNQSSLIRKINQATGVAPFDLVRVADLGDAQRKWRARIRVKRRLLHLGSYAFETDAAIAYNTHAGYLHGEFSRLEYRPGSGGPG